MLYHDVVDEDDDASGFPGAGAAQYKLRRSEFDAHIAAVAATGAAPTTLERMLAARSGASADRVLITFDDGGVSAATWIAGALERFGWHGHFLITTNCIGTAGFVSVDQIRELDRRGHAIGSHSCSHPIRMAACNRAQLLEEWRRSREVLSGILGRPVTSASIPGGYYSRVVAEAAAEAGFTDLFTSEPTSRPWEVEGCRVYGRYTLYRGMGPATAAAIASGSPIPLLRQAVTWNLKKLLKALGGRTYLSARQVLLEHKHRSPEGERRPQATEQP
jgi:peptidoglycan/xylan/chitin deacetylase (PgdA/CDA1 family)